MGRRGLAFAVLAAACAITGGVSVAIAVVGTHQQREAADRAVASARPRAQAVLAAGRPFVVFRNVDRVTYDDAARAQVQHARDKMQANGSSGLQTLLNGRDTWTVVG